MISVETKSEGVKLPAGRWVQIPRAEDAPARVKLIHIQNTTGDILMIYGALDGSSMGLMPGRDVWFFDAPKRMTFIS